MLLKLKCSPHSELTFSGSFCQSTLTKLTLENLEEDRKVGFKIKTTHPHRYVVKPHRGTLNPKETIELVITLLPFHYKSDQTYKDKFLVEGYVEDSNFRYENKLRVIFKNSNNDGRKTVSSSGMKEKDLEDVEPDDHQIDTNPPSNDVIVRELQRKIQVLKVANDELKKQCGENRNNIRNNVIKYENDHDKHFNNFLYILPTVFVILIFGIICGYLSNKLGIFG